MAGGPREPLWLILLDIQLPQPLPYVEKEKLEKTQIEVSSKNV